MNSSKTGTPLRSIRVIESAFQADPAHFLAKLKKGDCLELVDAEGYVYLVIFACVDLWPEELGAPDQTA